MHKRFSSYPINIHFRNPSKKVDQTYLKSEEINERQKKKREERERERERNLIIRTVHLGTKFDRIEGNIKESTDQTECAGRTHNKRQKIHT